MENKFIPVVYRAIRQQTAPVIAALKTGGIEAAKFEAQKRMQANLMKPIMDIYRVFGVWAAGKTQREIRASEQKAFGLNADLLRRIIEYFENNLLVKAVMKISETTRALILKTLIEGEQQGLGVKEIVAKLNAPDLSKARAQLIVRTEAIIAMNYGREEVKRTSRWETESVWIAADDARTRHSHRYIDGTRVKEGSKFAVPIYKGDTIVGYDLMSGPGDPNASAGNVCNCRCSMVTVAKRDAQGKLIPKRNISVILPGQFVRNNQLTTV